MEQNKANIFDILRAVAIFMIFNTHNFCVLPIFAQGIVYPPFFYTPAWAGCWIFFILSGYLLGKGFYAEKYDTSSVKGFLTFYARRLCRIVPLYLFFLLLVFCFISPELLLNKSIFLYLTFRFNGTVGSSIQTGALWFVSTIVHLYLLAPFVYKFILKKVKTPLFFIIFVVGGLALRLYQRKLGMDWNGVTYTPFYSNLDLFFGGMFFNVIVEKYKQMDIKPQISKFIQILSSVLLLGLIIKNTQIYSLVKSSEDIYFFTYAYICPTLYLIFTSFVIMAFEPKEKVKYAPLNFKNMLKNPVRFIEGFGVVSFSFYMLHSTVLYSFGPICAKFGEVHAVLFNLIKFNMSATMNKIWHPKSSLKTLLLLNFINNNIQFL